MQRSFFIWAIAVLLSSHLCAENGMGRHKRMFAVPAPKNVKIDGKLDDWDRSGRIEMFAVSETKEMQNGKFMMMYDNDAIYLGGQVKDPSPMMNRHNPAVDGDKGWDADSFQFRMSLDPSLGFPVRFNTYKNGDKGSGKVAHLILWYYTDKKQPCMQMHLGMDYQVPRPQWKPHGVVPNKFYRAAYHKDADGMGYSFEYRIPWSVFGMKKAYKANDLAAGTVQFNWSRPDGLKMTGMAGVCYDVMNKGGFPYQNADCWGKIVFCEKGNLPKDLVEEGVPPERPLPLTFVYDVPEDSEVNVTLFNAKHEVVRILVAQGKRLGGKVVERWDGLDDLDQLLPADTYTWKGLYHQAIKTKFLFSVHNSGQPPYKKDDNTGGWGGDHGNPTSACKAGKDLLLTWDSSESGWGIIKVNDKGRKIWGTNHDAVHIASDGKRFFTFGGHGFNQAAGVKIFDLKDGRPINWGNGHPYLQAPAGGSVETDHPTGIAYDRGTVYVAYRQRNLIGLFDAQSGNLRATWKLDKPGRMAPAADGALLVVSGSKIMKISALGKPVAFVDKHLDQPVGIAVGDDGKIYVANCGDLENVSVFNATGKYLKSIGKKGGRPRKGLYENDGMLEPGGIAIDSRNRLWVAETLDFPKRISVWDTATGRFVAEFFGASSYFGWASMDPRIPDEIYCHNVIWKINWENNTWKPYSTIWRATKANMVAAPNPGGYAGHFRVFTASNGRQYGFGQSSYGPLLYRRDGPLFKPFAGVIRLIRPPGYSPTGKNYKVLWDDPKAYPNGMYVWQDRNDDQTVQKDEVRPLKQGQSGLFNWLDKDLNAWCDSGFILKPVEVTKNGQPVYDLNKKEKIPFQGSNGNATSLYLDDQNNIYTLSPWGKYKGFNKYDANWNLQWSYPNMIQWSKALTLPVVTPGKLWGLTMPLGVAGQFTGAATYFNPYHIFTTDGLYVAMVMRDSRTGGLGADVTASETITGQLVKPDGMNRYFLLAGDQDGRVTEILGLDTVKRLKGGTYVLTKADVAKAEKARKDYEKALSRMQKLVIVRTKQALAAAGAVEKKIDGKRGFSVKMAYNKDNLYLDFSVRSPYELTNSFNEPTLLFKGGNCLDIQLATDLAADVKRKKPAPGDIRILVTRRGGKPFSVIYYPKIKGFVGKPIVLKSPTGQESFDKIEVTNKISLVYTKRPDGFNALVTIPLSLINLRLKPNQKIKLDLGYLYGNDKGTRTALRKYWCNNSFSANVTYDIPNESRLEPAEWGEAVVE